MIVRISWLQSNVNILSFQIYKAAGLDLKWNTEGEEESLCFNIEWGKDFIVFNTVLHIKMLYQILNIPSFYSQKNSM
jgi:hypothetical protein